MLISYLGDFYHLIYFTILVELDLVANKMIHMFYASDINECERYLDICNGKGKCDDYEGSYSCVQDKSRIMAISVGK